MAKAIARNYRPLGSVVHLKFVRTSTAIAVPALVHISGPHANFITKGTDSASEGYIGDYSVDSGLTGWLPSIITGSVLDKASTEITLQNALLRYFQTTTESFTLPANTRNVLRATDAGFSFKNNGDVTRYSAFGNRDVKVGDGLRVVNGSNSEELWTKVAKLVPNYAPAVVESAVTNSEHNAEVSGSTTVTLESSTSSLGGHTIPTATVAVVDGADWSEKLLNSGTATATINVSATIGGDVSAAKFKVVIQDKFGNSVYTAANVALTQDGSDYLLDIDADGSVQLSFADDAVFAVGDTYVLSSNAAFTPVVPEAGGDFTAPPTEKQAKEVTYIVTVTKGGVVDTDVSEGQRPVLSVTTTSGIDKSPVVKFGNDVTAPVNIGRFGVTLTVPAGNLITGDRYFITARTSYSDTVPTIILNNNIPATWVVDTDTSVSIDLFITKSEVTVPEISAVGGSVLSNWSIVDDGTDSKRDVLQLRSGLTLYDSNFTINDELVELPVYSNPQAPTKVFLYCRYFVSDLANNITQIDSADQLDSIVSGPIDPSNPLKYAAYNALANGEGSQVLLTSVADPSDLDSWREVIDQISDRDDVFHVLPLTFGDKQVNELFYQHIKAMNDDIVAKERVLYLIANDNQEVALAQSESDEYPLLGKLGIETGIENLTYATFNSDTDTVDFIELGLRKGDIIRTQFDYDANGNPTWKEYFVEEVINSSTVRLTVSPDNIEEDELSVSFEVWREQTNSEFADSISQTGGYQDYLVRYLYVANADPDVSKIGPAAALVGLIGSVVPHQGVSWYPLTGWSADGWNNQFSKNELDRMAANGVTVIARHPDGYITARHSVTTEKAPVAGNSITDLDTKLFEEMYIRNALLIKKAFRLATKGLVGVTNVSGGNLDIIGMNMDVIATQLLDDKDYPQLGGRLSKYENRYVRRHALLKDHVVCGADIAGQFPMNHLEMTLIDN
ncbi:hypothetical protein FACS1894214_0130 [Planctomycetales bacterium]|nr:hypothetical protein FACS1894214_0130 [Planctomycetales bacterium]